MTTTPPPRTELERETEAAFQRFWTIGNLDENWAAWPALFTEDVRYVEHIYGEMRGRAAIEKWITGLMAQNRDVHAVIDWYKIRGRRVVVNMQNRYYHPDPTQPHLDFPGITILEYAGNGLFGYKNQLDQKQYQQMVAPAFVCSSEAIRRELGWRPRHELADALKHAVSGYRAVGLL